MTDPIFDLFRAVMMAKESASRKEQQDDFVAKVLGKPEYFKALARDYFDRMIANGWKVEAETPSRKAFVRSEVAKASIDRMSQPRSNVKPPEVIREQREMRAAASLALLSGMKAEARKFLLLDIVMPDGKSLRQATGAECAKAGGFYAAVGKALKPTQVVDKHLTEGDLQNIRARFYQANEAA